MRAFVDVLLLVVMGSSLLLVASSRLAACVRATAVQGVALAIIPIALAWRGVTGLTVHAVAMGAGTLALKGVAIPALLVRTIRDVNVRREVEPFVSLHVSILLAAGLVALAFWLSTVLILPVTAPTPLLVPAAFATLLIGFLVIVSRRKALTQVIGYLALENGVFLFGQCLAQEMPTVVELGLLLDLFVGVFVFGIAIHHIQREFEALDTDAMTTLRDDRVSILGERIDP